MTEAEQPIGPGPLVAIAGASGVGKDSLIADARKRVGANAHFPRRVITRPPSRGEDHLPVGVEEFRERLERGEFAVWWQAHGLLYGIPVGIDEHVRAGRAVVVNVSRAALPIIAARYERTVIVRITLPDHVRQQRLRSRARESAHGIEGRLTRADPAPDHPVDVEIANVGTIAQGGERLATVIRTALTADRAALAPDARDH